MRKTNFYTALIFLVASILQTASAKVVDEQTAQKAAITFYKYNTNLSQSVNISAKLVYTRKESDNTVDFYVFDINPKGFVIVSADDNADPILAFSDETIFESNVPNTGIQDWMDDVSNNVSYIIKNNVPADATVSANWQAYSSGQNPIDSRFATSVSPLVTTTWNQSPYYNEYCPGGSVTGCVATAMAQIMKYWNNPTTGTGSYSYVDGSYGTLSADFGSTTYSWSSMPASLSSSSTTTQENAVATLMYQAGVSVAMEYSPSGSGAYVLQSENPGGPCAQHSYITYFGYSSTSILGVKKSAYTTSEWDRMILTDLNAKRPIEYEGFGSDGGHTWVLDGYNSSGLAHMNWGWGGLDNGYFKITDLNPSGIPLGSNNGAIFGIEPAAKSGINNQFNIQQFSTGTSTGSATVELTGPTSSIVSESFNVFPVPASASVNVRYSGSIYSTASVIICNTLGQTVAAYQSVNLTDNYQLDISKYADGIYFMSIISPDGSNKKVIKFIKE